MPPLRTILTTLLLALPQHAATAAETPAVPSFEVATLNAWGLPFPLAPSHRRGRLSALGRWLREASVDLVGLQEVWWGARSLLQLDGMRFPRAERGDSGLAVFSRVPVRHLRVTRFLQARGWDRFKAKGFLEARVQLPGAHTHLVVTHMQAGKDPEDARVRRHQVAQLLGRLRQLVGAALVMGDFNLHPEVPQDQVTAALLEEAGLRDAASELGVVDITHPRDRARYDRVLVRDGGGIRFRVEDVEVLQYGRTRDEALLPFLSDHLPVRARLRLEGAVEAPLTGRSPAPGATRG